MAISYGHRIHELEYEALVDLNAGDKMEAAPFDVVTGKVPGPRYHRQPPDEVERVTPRCVNFEGDVFQGDKILENVATTFDQDIEIERELPGWTGDEHESVHIRTSIHSLRYHDDGTRFEECISGWCVLSLQEPEEREIEFEVIEGGVGDKFIRWKITSGNAGRNVGVNRYGVYILVWGHM